MYVIEYHDDDLDDLKQRSLAGRFGRRGTIEYAYQVEMYMQDKEMLPTRWRRAYAIRNSEVAVVWALSESGTLRYLARRPEYSGEWVLPFVNDDRTHVVTGMWTQDATTMDEANAWAARQLVRDVATAVLLDVGGQAVFAAWERSEDGPVLVACGPSQGR